MTFAMTSDADIMGFKKVGLTPAASDISNPHNINRPEQNLINKAVEVALCYKGVEVHVRNLELNDDGLLLGQVFNFTHICTTQYEGLRLGQAITFRYTHVQHLLN